MITNNNAGKWAVDLQNLTCRNIENNMVVLFEKQGAVLRGKIKEIPIKLAIMWTRDPDGNKYIREAVIEADEAFFRAYFNKEVEKKIQGTQLIA